MHAIFQTQGAREYMEDTCIVKENLLNKDIHLYGVFDGHAGDYVSKFLAENTERIVSNIIQQHPLLDMDDVLFKSIQYMANALDPGKSVHTGSTCIIALRKEQKLYVANVGDCRAVMNNKEIALPITVDHKPGSLKEHSRIISQGGYVTHFPHDVPRVNGMLAVSRSLGDNYLHPFVRWEPEVSEVTIGASNHLLIIASDGLWDTMTNQDVIDVFWQRIQHEKGRVSKSLLHECARTCAQMAQKKGSGDNITIIATLTP